MNSKVYKWCAVPHCGNTTIKTPNKLFVFLPYEKTIRYKWLELARRDSRGIFPSTHLYFCEDHFDLPNDMENYMEYHLMGSVSQVRMKPGCIPTKYQCQLDRRKQTSDATEQSYSLKKKRKILIEECEKDLEKITIAKQLEHGENSCGNSTSRSLSASLPEVHVKIEREWDGASETSNVSLSIKHEVKVEEVLEPERLQPQDIAFNIQQCTVKQEPSPAADAVVCPCEAPQSGRSRGDQAVLRPCFVKLERILVEKVLHACTSCHKAFLQDSSLATHECSYDKRQDCKRNSCLELPRAASATSERNAELEHSIQPTVEVQRTPGGSRDDSQDSLRRRITAMKTLQRSIRVAPTERAVQLDLDQEKADAALSNKLDHVRNWLGELQAQECAEPIPNLCRTSSPPGTGIDAVSGIARLEPAPQAGSDHYGASGTTSGCIDVRPSTSGMVAASGRPVQIGNVGSEFDSDFDDELNMDEFAANVGVARDIPDDEELTEHECTIVNSVSRAMDEAVDRLTNLSLDFTWQENFDTFRGVPEEFSGPTPGPINDYDTPYEVFTSIWSTDFMELIVLETNRYARQIIGAKISAGTVKESSRLHRWTDTNVDEMYLFFALHILMGMGSRTSQVEYWKTTGYLQMPKFRQLMSYNRFTLLNKFIHFSDNSNASQNLPQREGVGYSAKLAKIAPVLRHLNSKFSKLYNLNKDVAIGESLTLFKSHLPWIQAIRSKAYELCESRTGYLWRFDIYTGKNSERGDVAPSVDLAGKSIEVVLDLLKGLENRGHLVAMDNFYNCPALSRYLKSLGFDCLGTLRPNRKHVPVEIAKVPKNVPKGKIIALHSGDVSCIAWKDSKMVCVISTYHNADTFVGCKAGRDLLKMIAVRDYNNTMGGVDLKDQQLSMYLLDRKRCEKWYMRIFKRLLNVSVLNSFIMLTESLRRRGMALLLHRDFREQLADSLVKRHCHSSLQETLATVPEDQRLRRDIVHVPEISAGSCRGNCYICKRNGTQKKVHLKCATCSEYLCPGDCWREWHSLHQLPGKDILIRLGRRRN